MTGRRAGFCSGSNVPGFANPIGGGYGRGAGFGRGFGGGRRRGYSGAGAPGPYPNPPAAPQMSREGEIETLKSQASDLGQALDDIRRRIEELESTG